MIEDFIVSTIATIIVIVYGLYLVFKYDGGRK